MVTFSFKEFGENLGTRQLGRHAREKLLPMIEQNDCVVLDFTGVDVVSNSFADISQLLSICSIVYNCKRISHRDAMANPVKAERRNLARYLSKA